MTNRLRSIAVLFALLAGTKLAPGQPVSARHAQVELLAHPAGIVPGAELQIGVHFVLEKGWHIYWSNPGDSGQPPVFQWQLPGGFTTGDIQWPRPERMQANSQLADYGYHDDVLLIVPVHAPKAIPSGAQPAKEKFAVEAKWLICREVCLADHANLKLDLPVGASEKENPGTAALFSQTAKRLPVALPRGWSVRTRSEKDDFVLTVSGGKTIAKALFFPLDPAQIENAAPQKLQPTPTGAKIVLKKSDLLVKPITLMRGVLALDSGPAYRIESPVR